MDTIKFCPKCEKEVNIKHFYKNKKSKDGLYTYCKSCSSQVSAAYHKTPKGRAAKKRADEKYAQTNGGKKAHRKARRKYNRSEKGRAKNKIWGERYKNTDKGVEVRKKSSQVAKEKIRGTDQYRARNAITAAVNSQKMPAAKTLLCSICGDPAAHYHHWSYKKEHWLDVIPVCVICHNKIHLKP